MILLWSTVQADVAIELGNLDNSHSGEGATSDDDDDGVGSSVSSSTRSTISDAPSVEHFNISVS